MSRNEDSKRDRLKEVPQQTGEEPEVFAIRRSGAGYEIDRRKFWKALGGAGGLGAASALEAADPPKGCTGIKAHARAVTAVAFSPDGKHLFSAGEDSLIKIWSVSTGKLEKTLKGHSMGIAALALTYGKKKKWLISAGKERKLKVWEAPKGKLTKTADNPQDLLSVAAAPEATVFATGHQKGDVGLWSLPDCKRIKDLTGHGGFVYAVAVSQDGKLLASGGSDRTIRLWSLPEGQSLATLKVPAGNVRSLGFSADGKLLAAARGSTIHVREVPDGKPIKDLSANTSAIWSLAVSPAGNLLVSGADDKNVRIWSLPDGVLRKAIPAHDEMVGAVAIHPDGSLAASASSDGSIRFWTLPDGEPGRCLYDPATIRKGTAMRQYRQMGPRTFTLPCGSKTPPGATCVCDCVASSLTYRSTEQVCICDTISMPVGSPIPAGVVCICNTIAVGTAPVPSTPRAPRAPRSGGGGGWSRGGGHYWRPT